MAKKKKKEKTSFIKDFFKSFVIGIGILFPIAASYLAVVLGMYERILDVINNFGKSLKTNFKFVLALVLGIGASVLTSALLIKFTYEKFPIATLLFFLGLIVGGLPLIYKKTENEFNAKRILAFSICLLIFGSLAFLSGNDAVISLKGAGFLKLIGVGALAAGTMIIPGVSGSAVLISIGYYKPMLDIIHETLKFSSTFGTNVLTIGLFGIGMIIGLLVVGKIMDILLKKHTKTTYFGIVGIIVGSIVNVIVKITGYKFILWEFIIGLVLFAIGFIISFKFIKED